MLCIFPGIYLYAVLTENLRGRQALRRSRNLVRGRRWKVFLIVLLGTLLTSIVSGEALAATKHARG